MARFLSDYAGRGGSPRYLAGALPQLPFSDRAFDLALVSHLLFSYSEHLGAEGHRAAVAELMRVSREVRLFPLLTLDGAPSPHLEPAIAQARAAAWASEIVPVAYAFQRGGDRMLRLRSPSG
jgi:ubiquinone/menaquinone biosynthesis C-methylase UbiE